MSQRPPASATEVDVRRVTVRMPEAQVEALDQLVDAGAYKDRSEAIRKAIGRKWEDCRAWGDSVDRFVEECVYRDPEATPMTTTEVYRRYVAWCWGVSEDAVSQNHFTRTLSLADVGYGRYYIDSETRRGYAALGLSEDVPNPGD